MGVTKYQPATWSKVLELISQGHSLRQIAALPDMPAPSAVIYNAMKDKDFAEQYARARDAALDLMAEETLALADDISKDSGFQGGVAVARARLRVDTRKWYLSKLAPKRYGDRLEVSGRVDVEHSIAEELRAARNARLAAVPKVIDSK
jgi:hypothetical protein